MQSRFRSSRSRDGTKLVLEQAQSPFWSVIKTSLVSRQVLHLLSKLQNWNSPKTGQYKTCIVSNTKIDCVYINIYIYCIYFLYIYMYISVNKRHISRKYNT